MENASFVIVCCFSRNSKPADVQRLAALPARPLESPYLVWTVNDLEEYKSPKCKDQDWCYDKMVKRSDMIYLSFDLRGHAILDDKVEPMPGITMAPCNFFKGKKPDLEKKPQFFLTFRGTNNNGLSKGISTVRQDLNDAFPNLGADFPGVFMGMRGAGYKLPAKPEFDEILDSSYALVPHGHGRWTRRLSEAIGACSIPVILVDGMTLPFEELIDWSQISISMPEEVVKKGGQAVLDLLPSDEATIRGMRQKICDINEKYFTTWTLRIAAMLESAAKFQEENGRERHVEYCSCDAGAVDRSEPIVPSRSSRSSSRAVK